MATVRVPLAVLWALAHSEGMDRYFGTPRGRVGGFQAAALAAFGIDTPARLLPMCGDHWPASVMPRCEQIAHDTTRRMRKSAALATGGHR
jgi:hypothetical protein